MSLTSNLANPKSKVSQFLRQEFPHVSNVMKLSRARLEEANVETIGPEGTVPWSILGQAIDYRLRFYYPQEGYQGKVENLVAYAGAELACGYEGILTPEGVLDLSTPAPTLPGYLNCHVVMDFFNAFKALVAAAAPSRCRLELT